MNDKPTLGPFLFDTSAESWFVRTQEDAAKRWYLEYLSRHQVHVSAVTIIERIRGYALLANRVDERRRQEIEGARAAYLSKRGRVWPVDTAVAVVAAEITILLPHPSTPPKRAHQLSESRQDRLVRWRFDILIAATALVARMALIHNNATDFESIRSVIQKSPERFPRLGPLELIQCGADLT